MQVALLSLVALLSAAAVKQEPSALFTNRPDGSRYHCCAGVELLQAAKVGPLVKQTLVPAPVLKVCHTGFAGAQGTGDVVAAMGVNAAAEGGAVVT